MRVKWKIGVGCAVAILAGLLGGQAHALEPDEIALVVNANVPAGRKLAQYYAAQRHIPDDRIIELSLLASKEPAQPFEDMLPEEYDQRVVPVIREFLTKRGLDKKVTCLVTFWGVPLRVDARSNTEADQKEVVDLKAQLEELRIHLDQQVKAAEALAAALDTEFHGGSASDLDNLAHRGEAALNSVLQNLAKVSDASKRANAYDQMMDLIRNIAGSPAATQHLSQPDLWPLAPKPPTTEQIMAARNHDAELLKKVNDIEAEPQTIETRAKLRGIFKDELGSVNLARLIVAQIRATDTAESESAFDSELALLWWSPYPKSRWTLNPLDWHYTGHLQLPKHTLMVTRLDGPTEQSVRDVIDTSILIENRGLTGEVVLDARGKPPTEPYGIYDQNIRNLADFLRTKTSLKVVLDNKDSLIPDNSEKDIAIYCGWYSLRNYVAPGQFNPGAVGFHVASAEMVSLHGQNEKGWCQNLMKAGVVSTVGPVAEPYLQSFPPASEFFPLLMTGKLTLAEVYWKTTPWASWMQCCVGDPLYRPYKLNPPVKADDLPAALKSLVQ